MKNCPHCKTEIIGANKPKFNLLNQQLTSLLGQYDLEAIATVLADICKDKANSDESTRTKWTAAEKVMRKASIDPAIKAV